MTLQLIPIAENHILHHVGTPGEALHFRLQTGAVLHYFLPVLESSKTQVRVELEGAGAQVHSHIVFLGTGKEDQAIDIQHLHLGKNTRSTLVAKGAAKDKARGNFIGTITMKPGSLEAVGSLEEHALILSPLARISTLPALEINHNDVQASHAATIERVDAERLFYLRSRGLSEQQGLELMVEGFFRDALEALEDTDLRSALLENILTRLA